MANRSDFNSSLPRQFKRMLALGEDPVNEHSNGEVRRIFIDAHKHHKAAKIKMLRGKTKDDDVIETPVIPV